MAKTKDTDLSRIQEPTQSIEYCVYYQKKPSVIRPAAVLFGSDWIKWPNDQNLDNRLGFISVHPNNSDNQMKSDITRVKHSNDLLIVHPKNGSFIFIYGERGDGIRISSNSMIKIAGILQIPRNGEKLLDGGRHTIQSTFGDLKLVICDQNKVLMICDSENNFVIDDESYLDEGPDDGSVTLGRSPQNFPSKSIQNNFNSQFSSAKNPNTRTEDKSGETKTKELSLSRMSGSVPPVQYIIYYEQNHSIQRPVAVLMGKDWTTLQPKYHLGSEGNNGFSTIDMNAGADQIQSDLNQIKNSNNSVTIHSRNGSFVYIYDQRGNGIRIGSKAKVILEEMPEIIGKPRIINRFEGKHNITSTSGDITLVMYGHKVVLIGDNFVVNHVSYADQYSVWSTGHQNRYFGQNFNETENVSTFGQRRGLRSNRSDLGSDPFRSDITQRSENINDVFTFGGGRGHRQYRSERTTFPQSDRRITFGQERSLRSVNDKNRYSSQPSHGMHSFLQSKSSDVRQEKTDSEVSDHRRDRLKSSSQTKLLPVSSNSSQMNSRANRSEEWNREEDMEKFERFKERMRMIIGSLKHGSADSSANQALEELRMSGRQSHQTIGSHVEVEKTTPSSHIQKCPVLQPKVRYILYFCHFDGRVYPIGTVVGSLFGQTHNTKVLEVIPKSDKWFIRVILYNRGDTELEDDMKRIFGGDLVTVKSVNDAKIFVYDEQCDGFVLGNGSKLKINAKPFKSVATRQIPLNPNDIQKELMSCKSGNSFHFVLSDRKLICFQTY